MLLPCEPPTLSAFAGPNRSKLQDMLANLRDAEDLPSMQPPVAPPARPSLPRLNEHDLGRADEGVMYTKTHTHNKLYSDTFPYKFLSLLSFFF